MLKHLRHLIADKRMQQTYKRMPLVTREMMRLSIDQVHIFVQEMANLYLPGVDRIFPQHIQTLQLEPLNILLLAELVIEKSEQEMFVVNEMLLQWLTIDDAEKFNARCDEIPDPPVTGYYFSIQNASDPKQDMHDLSFLVFAKTEEVVDRLFRPKYEALLVEAGATNVRFDKVGDE